MFVSLPFRFFSFFFFFFAPLRARNSAISPLFTRPALALHPRRNRYRPAGTVPTLLSSIAFGNSLSIVAFRIASRLSDGLRPIDIPPDVIYRRFTARRLSSIAGPGPRRNIGRHTQGRPAISDRRGNDRFFCFVFFVFTL